MSIIRAFYLRWFHRFSQITGKKANLAQGGAQHDRYGVFFMTDLALECRHSINLIS